MTCVSNGVVQGGIAYNDSNTTATFTPNCSLASGTRYTAAVAASAALTDGKTWQFTTIAGCDDSDDDGVQDNEDDHPDDHRKATPPNPKGKGKWLVDTSDNPGMYLSEVSAISDTSARICQAGKPVGYEFRNGLVSYKVGGVPSGGTVTVKITSPDAIPAGSKVFKADSTGFHEIGNAVLSGNTLTLTLTDGGSGDSDGQANGIIFDPVGVASPTASGSGTIGLSTEGSSGGGCAVAAGRRSETRAIDGFLLLAPIAVLAWRFRSRRNRR